jgi:hypothetical protein
VTQSPRNTFLGKLDEWEYNFPLNSQWIIIIHKFPQLIRSKIADLESKSGKNDWNISEDLFSKLTTSNIQSTMEMGCFFIDNVDLPGESYAAVDVNSNSNGGYITPTVAGARASNGTREFLTTFRETNADFVEAVIKPWIVMGSYYGHFAYEDENKRVRIPKIQVISFGKLKHSAAAPYDQQSHRPVRKIYNFFNCAPVGVDGKRMSYNEDVGIEDLRRSVRWSYDNFTVQF